MKKSEKSEKIEKLNIAYYRISTKKQGVSGLGLDSQKSIVRGFLYKEPDFEFIETETGTGKGSNRYELNKAIKKVKDVNGRLVIAVLDRLSRNVNFISGLMESGVDFVCCDMPQATPFTLHILASVAEHEAKLISSRTKNALKAKVSREINSGNLDFKLGPPKGKAGLSKDRIVDDGKMSPEEINKKRIESLKRVYDENPNNLLAIGLIKEMYESGKKVKDILNRLNELGFKAPNGGIFHKLSVYRILYHEGLKEKRKKKINEESIQ